MSPLTNYRCWAVVALLLLPLGSVWGASPSEPSRDFSGLYDLIYQVKVVTDKAGSKSSIGSGFQISADGLIVTNYHVISAHVSNPDRYRIEYLDQQGNSGPLQLLDFDVIHDLALLRHPDANERFFQISPSKMSKGDMIYALGNPHDLGITLVFGAYNGPVEHSYDEQILFSGSLNPGMSGGPGLNDKGDVIGVNVATAGSQLSFLVPAERVTELRDRARTLDAQDYPGEIAAQVLAWQERRLGSLLEVAWTTEPLGASDVLGEIRQDFQCWGSSNEDNQQKTVEILRRTCNAGNRLFIDGRLTTGQIHFSFEQKRAVSLSPYRFHKQLSKQGLSGDNRVTKDDVTPYQCHNAFLSNNGERLNNSGYDYSKGTYCVRAYKELVGLFDVLFLAENNGAQIGHSAHFTLAGVSASQAQAFADKFMAVLQWK